MDYSRFPTFESSNIYLNTEHTRGVIFIGRSKKVTFVFYQTEVCLVILVDE